MLDQITPLILTYNESPNIQRTLDKLQWANEIVVIDSFSCDGTVEILKRSPIVRLVQRAFDSHTQQWNFGLQQIQTPWVLSLDADYVLSDQLVDEMRGLNQDNEHSGYSAAFKYCVCGRPLRASLYPPRTVLFRRSGANYRDDGHTQLLEVKGRVVPLRSPIYHDDRKPLERWLNEQRRYVASESHLLFGTPPNRLNCADRLRRLVVVAPWLVLIYTLIWKRLILDGWPGWYYVIQRTYVELLLSLELLDLRLKINPDLDGTFPRTPR